MLPVKGGLVEAGIGRDRLSNEGALRTGENAKGGRLHVRERRVGRNVTISEEFEHLSGLVEVQIAFQAGRRDTGFSGFLGFVGIPAHVMEQAVEQMIVEALITVEHKAQEVEGDRPRLEAFELGDRVITNGASSPLIKSRTYGNRLRQEKSLFAQFPGILAVTINYPYG